MPANLRRSARKRSGEEGGVAEDVVVAEVAEALSSSLALPPPTTNNRNAQGSPSSKRIKTEGTPPPPAVDEKTSITTSTIITAVSTSTNAAEAGAKQTSTEMPPPTAAATPTTSSTNRAKTPPIPSAMKNNINDVTITTTTFRQLHNKYGPDLDYMLVEFRKLERQLLGTTSTTTTAAAAAAATVQQQPKTEIAGSKERREKLHGFILHLEDTIGQIDQGCVSEEELKNSNIKVVEQQQQEAEVEEESPANKLEQHIIANLLPVKQRLTRQLAAQKGATKNPSTAPVLPGGAAGGNGGMTMDGYHHSVKGVGVGTAEAKRNAQQRIIEQQQRDRERKEEEMKRRATTVAKAAAGGAADTTSAVTCPWKRSTPVAIGQVGGSALTSRLHGRGPTQPLATASTTATTISSSQTPALAGGGGMVADSTKPLSTPTNSSTAEKESTPQQQQPNRRTILFAGMAPGSTQVPSSINAAEGAHPGLIDERATRTLQLAEDDRALMRRLEDNATRMAGGGTVVVVGERTKTTLSSSTVAEEGPATLAAKALATGAAVGIKSTENIIGESSQPFATLDTITAATTTMHHPSHSIPRIESVVINPTTTKSPHVPLNFNDPSLIPEQQFDMRLQEARWRQRKRRRARRRKRIGGCSHHGVGGRGMTMMTTMTTGGYNANHQLILLQQLQQQAQASQQAQSIMQQQQQQHLGVSHNCYTNNSSINNNNNSVTTDYDTSSLRRQTIEYVCSVCNTTYPYTSELNPWWCLINHECPQCGKVQIPRLDITKAVNALEYHPALIATLDDNGFSGGGGVGGVKIADMDALFAPSSSFAEASSLSSNILQYQQTSFVHGEVTYITPHQPTTNAIIPAIATTSGGSMIDNTNKSSSNSDDDSDVSQTDESDGEGGSAHLVNDKGYDYDESSDEDDDEVPLAERGNESDEDEDLDSITMEDMIDREEFGHDYNGEILTDDHARRLLILIDHASTCPGKHQSTQHRDVCHSTKYLMLHVRDCSGLLDNGDICPFPWCRKVKHLLYHLVSCVDVGKCTLCSSVSDKLSPNLNKLMGLNLFRREKCRSRTQAVKEKCRQPVLAASAAAEVSSTAVNLTIAKYPMVKVSTSSMNNQHTTTTASTLSPSSRLQYQHMPSPALLSRYNSSISMTALPTLEEAAMGLADLGLSTLDLVGLSSLSNYDLSTIASMNAPSSYIGKSEAN